MFLFFLKNDWYVKKVKSSSYPCTRGRTRRGVETEGFFYILLIFTFYIAGVTQQ